MVQCAYVDEDLEAGRITAGLCWIWAFWFKSNWMYVWTQRKSLIGDFLKKALIFNVDKDVWNQNHFFVCLFVCLTLTKYQHFLEYHFDRFWLFVFHKLIIHMIWKACPACVSFSWCLEEVSSVEATAVTSTSNYPRFSYLCLCYYMPFHKKVLFFHTPFFWNK